jgi:hypothetical protein
MTKLVSFIVFIAAFIWTWFLFNSKNDVSFEIHAGLQSKLAKMIEESVTASKPGAFDFKMQSIYTKTLNANKVSAYYKYNFSEKLQDGEVAMQTIEGEALLNRTISENQNEEKWVVQSVKTQNPTVEFQEGVIIGSSTPASQDTNNTALSSDGSVDQNTAAPAENPSSNIHK